jgi:hypothetical protein
MSREFIAARVAPLPVAASLKLSIADAADLVLSRHAVFRAEEQLLAAEFPRTGGTSRADRLCMAFEKAAGVAILDAPDEDAHARRIVLVGALALYPGDLPPLGEFGAWRWRSAGHPMGYVVRYHGGRADDWVPGRETALFWRHFGDEDRLELQPWLARTLEKFGASLAHAVERVRCQPPPATTMPAVPPLPTLADLTPTETKLYEFFADKVAAAAADTYSHVWGGCFRPNDKDQRQLIHVNLSRINEKLVVAECGVTFHFRRGVVTREGRR